MRMRENAETETTISVYTQRGIELIFAFDDERRAEVIFRPPVLLCVFFVTAIRLLKSCITSVALKQESW